MKKSRSLSSSFCDKAKIFKKLFTIIYFLLTHDSLSIKMKLLTSFRCF